MHPLCTAVCFADEDELVVPPPAFWVPFLILFTSTSFVWKRLISFAFSVELFVSGASAAKAKAGLNSKRDEMITFIVMF